MSYFIVGTAGHIDHGKTTLVKALTGIDTDRLKEEKIRGITIETGYAYLKIPNKNITIGFIDVPGHEKFIKNMVTGIYGIDVLMLIIAADESIMPQTIEHLEICRLLGIKRGFIVVTKIDLVDEEMLELVKEEINDFTKDTFLENSPIFFVSAQTGEGIEKLKNYLIELSEKVTPEKPVSSIFRLPIDRVFTLKGFGTVVTGTTISGKIKVGNDVIIYPQEINSKVRNIHVHNSQVDEAFAGQRTALNLQGIEKEEIHRGSIVTEPNWFSLKNYVFAQVYYLESNKRPLNSRTTIKFHINTDIIPSKINFIQKKFLTPGEKCFCIFYLSHPTIVLNGDRFIIRSFDDKNTLGGGVVAFATKKKEKIDLELLNGFISNDNFVKIESFFKYKNFETTTLKDIISNFNIPLNNAQKILKEFLKTKKIVQIDKDEYIYLEFLNQLKSKIITHISEFHSKNPHLFGIHKEELKTKLGENITTKLFNFLIDSLVKENKIDLEEKNVKLKNFSIKLDDKKSKIIQDLYNAIKNGNIKPPSFKELASTFNLEEKDLIQYLNILIKEEKIEKISPEIYFEKTLFEKIKNQLIDYLSKNKEITIKEFKSIADTSRKYIIPLLEYFDKLKITVRVGDKRTLRK